MLETVYLYTINLESGSVRLDEAAGRYAYDADGSFLGSAAAQLPYRQVYYISAQGQAAAGTGPESSSSGSAPPDPQSPAPDCFYDADGEVLWREKPGYSGGTGNVNDNPDTGK